MESLEVGSRVLLVDEDTAATNFMIRSAAMQRLVAPEKEPITPFIAKIRPLSEGGPEGGNGAIPPASPRLEVQQSCLCQCIEFRLVRSELCLDCAED